MELRHISRKRERGKGLRYDLRMFHVHRVGFQARRMDEQYNKTFERRGGQAAKGSRRWPPYREDMKHTTRIGAPRSTTIKIL